MEIKVSGHHIDVGDSLRQYVKDVLSQIVQKYCTYATSANVKILMERHKYIVTEIEVHSGKKAFLTSHGSDYDAYKSVDAAINKMESQLKKYNKKLQSYHHKRKHEDAHTMQKYVFNPQDSYFEDDSTADNPIIIAEKLIDIERLSVSDAVMKMETNSHGTYIFINSATEKLNLIFYRKDGNIAWVDISTINDYRYGL